MSEPKPDWRRRAERAERENLVMRAELAKARRIYGDHLTEIVDLKMAIKHAKALLEDAMNEIDR